MPNVQIDIQNKNRPDLDTLLDNLIYEYNCLATGITDGELLNATLEDEHGNILAAINGYTWGECCEIVNLFVHENVRHKGMGSALLQAAAKEAVARGCHQIMVSTHSFQTPKFYEKHGFNRIAAISNYPKGYEKIFYVKELKNLSDT